MQDIETTTRTAIELDSRGVEAVVSAVLRDEPAVLDALVDEALDRDDEWLLERAAEWLDSDGDAQGASTVEHCVEIRCQRLSAGAETWALFCLPVLVAGDEDMPVRAFAEALDAHARAEERWVLLDGWAHVDDLSGMRPGAWRRLTRDLARRADGAGGVTGMPSPGFERSPVARGDLSGTMASISAAGSVRMVPRMALGLVRGVHGAQSGLLAELVEGRAGSLVSAMVAALPAGDVAARPTSPVACAARTTSHMVESVLSARFEALARPDGRRPISHLFVGRDEVRIVMRDFMDRFSLDAATLHQAGLDLDALRDIVTAGSRGVVLHDSADTLPPAPAEAVAH